MRPYDYKTQRDAIEYADAAREYLAAIKAWLNDDIESVMDMLRELPKPQNATAYEQYRAVCMVTLEYALKKMSIASLISKSSDIKPSVKSLVKQSMMTNRIPPELIIGMANAETDISEGA